MPSSRMVRVFRGANVMLDLPVPENCNWFVVHRDDDLEVHVLGPDDPTPQHVPVPEPEPGPAPEAAPPAKPAPAKKTAAKKTAARKTPAKKTAARRTRK